MISTAPTKIAFPTSEDGGIRDPDPRRRAQRLRDAGVRIARPSRFDYRVLHDDHVVGRRRTYGSAERLAHRHADPRDGAVEEREPPVHFHAGPQGQPTPCFEQHCSSPRLSV